MKNIYSSDGAAYMAATMEPPICEHEAPSKTEYECDVLVIGGGFAGFLAAITAAEAGKNVVLVDKGRPGYSGQSPWAGVMRWYDPELGDDKEAMEAHYLRGAQYCGNQNWVKVWMDHSKSVYEKLRDLGLFEDYDTAVDTGHGEQLDYVGYREYIGKRDRHAKFVPILRSKGVRIVEHTMVYDIIRQNDRIVGAIGFHTPSGAAMVFHAKATIMCMGGGAYKPAGWPTGGISYDAVAIAYKLGLPVIGQEYEDFHSSYSDGPSNAWTPNAWAWLSRISFTGGDFTKDSIAGHLGTSGATISKAYTALYGRPIFDGVNNASNHFTLYIPRPTPPESGPRKPFRRPSIPKPDVYGASSGFCMHTASGIYCGDEDTHGYTGIPGLYCAGDGCNAGPVGGCIYPGGGGFTSNFAALQGRRSAEAAIEYVDTIPLTKISSKTIEVTKEEMFAPLNLEEGFSANWALDCLQGIMIPPWTLVLKTKERLEAALTQVIFLRDTIVPRLQAASSHDLRYCLELKNKVLEAEMKLRASLAREESRGAHYREDFPMRDDENFLCYIGLLKDEETGDMKVVKIDYPDEWKGDLSEPYVSRYSDVFFPGEEEALKAKGIL